MNYRVREYLIDLAAKEKIIYYQQLSDACGLGLDMQASEWDRAEIGRILGEVSIYEHENGRPLISAIVLSKGSLYEGDGFYKLGEELGFGPWKYLRDGDFAIKQMKACYEFWKNKENYSKYRNITYV
ncbi:MAG TPA: hypothetical protein PLZ15_07110 [Melioribacteraceae bacterium]|nr:hypothetical protein [Melioribacteraceae bacterium]